MRYAAPGRLWATAATAVVVMLVAACSDDATQSSEPADASDVAADGIFGDQPSDPAPDPTPDGDGDGSIDMAGVDGADAQDDAADVPADAADAADAADIPADAGDVGGLDTSEGNDLSDAADATSDRPTPSCAYPVEWRPDSSAEAAALADLGTLAPGASVDWSDERGTIMSATDLGIVLDCPDDTDVFGVVFALFEAWPDVFQIDVAEWERPPVFTCQNVQALNRTLTIGRRQLGPGAVNRDIVTVTLRREEDEVILRSFFGAYVPVVPQAVRDEMARCPVLTAQGARAAVDAETFPYTIFEQCVEQGSGVYTPQPNDILELDEEPFWSWVDSGDTGSEDNVVLLTKEHFGRLIIDPGNVTLELEASDANCPEVEGPGRVYGFRITFDAVLESILSKMPGVGCIVC